MNRRSDLTPISSNRVERADQPPIEEYISAFKAIASDKIPGRGVRVDG